MEEDTKHQAISKDAQDEFMKIPPQEIEEDFKKGYNKELEKHKTDLKDHESSSPTPTIKKEWKEIFSKEPKNKKDHNSFVDDIIAMMVEGKITESSVPIIYREEV